MEWLLTLVPIAFVVLVCGGLHMLMMRGMHSGHDTAAGHGGHLPARGPSDSGPIAERLLEPEVPGARRHHGAGQDRVAELEEQVASLQQEIDAMLTYPQKTGNNRGPARIIALHHNEAAWRDDSEAETSQGE